MEIMMSVLPQALSRARATVLLLSAAETAVAQAPAPPPLTYPPPLLTPAEARAVIEGAIAYARESNMRMAVVVVDSAGNIVSSDRMDGAALQNIRFAEGKAFASALYRQTTEALGELYKTRPDRYFGIINMYRGRFISWAVECRSPSTASSSEGSAWPACREASSRNLPRRGSAPGCNSLRPCR